MEGLQEGRGKGMEQLEEWDSSGGVVPGCKCASKGSGERYGLVVSDGDPIGGIGEASGSGDHEGSLGCPSMITCAQEPPKCS